MDGISIVAHGGRGKWRRVVGQRKTEAARSEVREQVRGGPDSQGRGGGSSSMVASMPPLRVVKDTLFRGECVNADEPRAEEGGLEGTVTKRNIHTCVCGRRTPSNKSTPLVMRKIR